MGEGGGAHGVENTGGGNCAKGLACGSAGSGLLAASSSGEGAIATSAVAGRALPAGSASSGNSTNMFTAHFSLGRSPCNVLSWGFLLSDKDLNDRLRVPTSSHTMGPTHTPSPTRKCVHRSPQPSLAQPPSPTGPTRKLRRVALKRLSLGLASLRTHGLYEGNRHTTVAADMYICKACPRIRRRMVSSSKQPHAASRQQGHPAILY